MCEFEQEIQFHVQVVCFFEWMDINMAVFVHSLSLARACSSSVKSIHIFIHMNLNV